VTQGWADAQSAYLQNLLRGDRWAACNLAVSIREQGHALTDIYVDILQESMIQVGQLWESNRISVADEHRATIITQFVMAHLYPSIKQTVTPKSKIIVTGVEGEMHQLGGNMVADVWEEEGHLVQFLGTNLPTSCIIDRVKDQRPDLLGISATMLCSLPKVAHLIACLRQSLGPQAPRILLGGAALRQAPDFAEEQGALGCASDLRSALDLVRSAIA